MSVPSPWEALLIAFAAFRVWRLLAEDTILDKPRRWFLRLGNWERDGDPVPDGYRAKWGELFQCPWCLGFWISLAWWGAWQVSEKWALVVATPFAISAGVGLIRTNLDPPED